jgi:pyridoxine 5-phosphate synthase
MRTQGLTMSEKLRLGINIDHVATLRNARGGTSPDPVRAAHLAVAAGADGITAHLREDRRHIRDADMERLRTELAVPLNFEMAATDEMIALAVRLRPHAACLVPEKREERTTEGGLDVVGQAAYLAPRIAALRQAGCRVSLFIEADDAPIRASRALGADIVELHTGTWCEAVAHGDLAKASRELARLVTGAALASSIGLEVHAGHGLDFATARILAATPQFVEFNIGHFLMGEAVFIGIGSDLCDIRRIANSLERFGARFTDRIFTPGEQAKAESRLTQAETYARRFAAKEACSKALGTGMRRGVFWRDMEVVTRMGGQPTMRLTGGAAARLARITPPGHEAVIHVSLSDEPPMAMAYVIIEARPLA